MGKLRWARLALAVLVTAAGLAGTSASAGAHYATDGAARTVFWDAFNGECGAGLRICVERGRNALTCGAIVGEHSRHCTWTYFETTRTCWATARVEHTTAIRSTFSKSCG